MEEILIFGHKNPDTDSICSSMVKQILDEKDGKNNTKAVRLGNINKETGYVLDYLKIEPPELIEKVDEGQKVILVDHNEFGQSVSGIEKAKIIGVIDHHRISDFETSEPLYYTARPYGCTATILYNEFVQKGIKIERKEAVLMLSAIISDTLLLSSPTTTDHDRDALEELAKIADVSTNIYGLEMLKAGTDLSMYSAAEIINLDSKEFTQNSKKIAIAQVNTADIDEVFQRKEELAFEMEKQISDRGLSLFMLLITDIINTNSKAIVLGKEKELAEKAFNKKLDSDDAFMLEGVVSRKKQVAPPLLEVL